MIINPQNIILDQYDLDSLEDTVFQTLDIENLTKEEIMAYWNKLPYDINPP